MKKILFTLLLLVPTGCFAQFIGLGYQTADFEKHQFATNILLPYPSLMMASGDNIFIIGGGLDYTTSDATVSGLNIKPASLSYAKSGMMKGSSTFMLRMDAGYNFNFKHGNNGIILSPSIYADYSIFYLNAGYDYNAIHNEGQVFLRLGVGITWSTIKGSSSTRRYR